MNESRSIIARLTQEQQDILERIDDLNDKKDQLAGMKEYQSELSARYDIVKKTDKYLTSAKDNLRHHLKSIMKLLLAIRETLR